MNFFKGRNNLFSKLLFYQHREPFTKTSDLPASQTTRLSSIHHSSCHIQVSGWHSLTTQPWNRSHRFYGCHGQCPSSSVHVGLPVPSTSVLHRSIVQSSRRGHK